MPEYKSGSCNIGSVEVRRRKISGIIGGVLSITFYIATLVMRSPQSIRALVFFPLVMATIGWFQSRRNFCLVFGLTGVFNFGRFGERTRIVDPVSRSADRALALKMLAQAIAVAAPFALIFTFIPA